MASLHEPINHHANPNGLHKQLDNDHLQLSSKDTAPHEEYHLVSNLLEGTKRITSTIYDQTGLSNYPSVDEKMKSLRDLSDNYLNKCANIIDVRLDNAIRRSKNLMKMTKKGLKKLSNEERMLVTLVRTWCSTHLSDARNGLASLQEFVTTLGNETQLKVKLDTIKQKVGVFYEVASTAWGRFQDRKTKDMRRVILEIVANSLLTFQNMKEETVFAMELVNFGEVLLEERNIMPAVNGESSHKSKEHDQRTSVQDFLIKVKVTTGSNLNPEKEKDGVYDELATKFYSIVLQFRKLVEAQETFSHKTSNWVKLAKNGGEGAFSTLEGLVGRLHDKFVEHKGSEEETSKLLQDGQPKERNGTSHRKKSGQTSIVKIQESYLERSKHLLSKLNEVRLAIQKQMPSPYNLIKREVSRLIAIGRDVIGFLTLATINLVDRIYLPTSQFVKTRLMANQRIVAMQVYFNGQKEKVLEMIENNERFKQLKRFVIVTFEDQKIKMKLRLSKLKDLKQDLENFVREVIVLARQKDVTLKQLPTKVYSLALEMYKQRNVAKQLTNAPVSNGTATHEKAKKGKKHLL